MLLDKNRWRPSQQENETGDLVNKLQTMPRHGEQDHH